MALLARAGDSAAALGAYADFSRRLRQEYDAEPSADSLALARALKQPGLLPESASPPGGAADGAEAPPPPRTWRRRRGDAFSCRA